MRSICSIAAILPPACTIPNLLIHPKRPARVPIYFQPSMQFQGAVVNEAAGHCLSSMCHDLVQDVEMKCYSELYVLEGKRSHMWRVVHLWEFDCDSLWQGQ